MPNKLKQPEKQIKTYTKREKICKQSLWQQTMADENKDGFQYINSCLPRLTPENLGVKTIIIENRSRLMSFEHRDCTWTCLEQNGCVHNIAALGIKAANEGQFTFEEYMYS